MTTRKKTRKATVTRTDKEYAQVVKELAVLQHKFEEMCKQNGQLLVRALDAEKRYTTLFDACQALSAWGLRNMSILSLPFSITESTRVFSELARTVGMIEDLLRQETERKKA